MKRLFKRIVIGFMVILLPLLPLAAQSGVGNIKCTLKGEVIDRPQSSQLILLKEGEDFRVNGISIPIQDGKFEYVLNCDHEELYQLVFNDELARGAWRPIVFISEQGVVHFTLHPPEQFGMNRVEGGKLNEGHLNFQIEERKMFESFAYTLNAKIEQLQNDNKYFTPEAQSLIEQMRASTDDNERRTLSGQLQKLRNERLDITLAAREVMASGDSLTLTAFHRRLLYAKEHPDIVGYSILISTFKDIVRNFKSDILPFIDVYNAIYAPKYPNHPYTTKILDLVTGSSLKAGVPFIDFTAVDLTGKQVRLSERIGGKPAVLHLWASWCGPCRKKGRDLIPVYEEFRDKGFVVIGVAREKTISTAEAAIELDKYPWENLVELNDVEQIWVKYGLGNAGGDYFLIDEQGTIVAVEPSVEEIKNFLKTR